MTEIIKIQSVSQFNNERGQNTLHPLVSILDQSKSCQIKESRYLSELYIVFLKDSKCEDLKYGRNNYDYEDGSILFIAPGQIFGFQSSGKLLQPSGWALCFHPELLRGTNLAKSIREYSFFSYDSNEALHVSEKEKITLIECFNKILIEITQPIDKHTRTLIVNNIELFLNLCTRFYDRQFITREFANKDVLSKFERLIDAYFYSGKSIDLGLPSVYYFSKELNLSPKYFGDLIKKLTGNSAQDYIHLKLITIAKEKVLDTSKSISEIAFELGFKYPSHFTRLFKQKVGQSPVGYRNLN